MRILSRILTICLCSAPFVDMGANAVVATTAGHNLTAYNPSNMNNNQWAGMTNVRDNTGQPTAKVDFGNCNALIMRCATPKCANGGCVDANIATAIVAGCVQSNNTCAQYGNELVSYMSAQLVASSTAKVNAQRAAADAAAAQSAASEQTAQQIAQMQQSMQQQMSQMQQQIVEQNAAAQQQLQDALTAQQEQNAAALKEINAQTTMISPVVTMQPTAVQEDAIDRGVSAELMVRQQMTGQIMTQIDNAEVSLKAARTAMQNSFEYAGCDARGNNCTGPKRIKKWRELASGFLEPYDNTIDSIYDALDNARGAGVDLSQIEAMLTGTCNSWSVYMCPGVAGGFVTYGYYKENKDGQADEYVTAAPRVCTAYAFDKDGNPRMPTVTETSWKQCRPCTWAKALTENEDIYAGWLEPSNNEAKENQRVVACSSSALEKSPLFSRRTKSKNGAGVVDINALDTWLHQTDPNTNTNAANKLKYCSTGEGNYEADKSVLEKAMLSRSVDQRKSLCINAAPDQQSTSVKDDSDECPYISGSFAICDTHPYNAGLEKISDVIKTDSSNSQNSAAYQDIEKMKEIIALKVTVISQQMYKQYEYLNATLRRLKTQLEKSILTSTLKIAGAKDEDSSSGMFGGVNEDGTIVLAGAENCANKMSSESIYSCIQNNVSLIISSAKTNTTKACKQLNETIYAANVWDPDTIDTTDKATGNCNGIEKNCNRSNVVLCAQELNSKIARKKENLAKDQRRMGLGYGI